MFTTWFIRRRTKAVASRRGRRNLGVVAALLILALLAGPAATTAEVVVPVTRPMSL